MPGWGFRKAPASETVTAPPVPVPLTSNGGWMKRVPRLNHAALPLVTGQAAWELEPNSATGHGGYPAKRGAKPHRSAFRAARQGHSEQAMDRRWTGLTAGGNTRAREHRGMLTRASHFTCSRDVPMSIPGLILIPGLAFGQATPLACFPGLALAPSHASCLLPRLGAGAKPRPLLASPAWRWRQATPLGGFPSQKRTSNDIACHS